MRFLKWVSALTILAMLFVMLPATVAEDEIVIEMEEPVDVELGIEVVEEEIEGLDDRALSLENADLELEGLEDNLLTSEVEGQAQAIMSTNGDNDFEIDEDGVLTKYNGYANDVIIPNGVKKIADYTFSFDKNISSVVIPDSVTIIGLGAFTHCSNLTKIIIPDSVIEIGGSAFDMSGLISVKLPKYLKGIDYGLFTNCFQLEEVIIPDSIEYVGEWAFFGCHNLKNVILPDGITSIGEKTFSSCSALESVTIPASVTTIDRTAFESCNKDLIIRGIDGSEAQRFAEAMDFLFNAPVVAFEEETHIIRDGSDYYEAAILYINQSRTFNAVQKPADLSRTLCWSSSDNSIATVDQNGTVKGISQGKVTITAATADGKGNAAQIKVVVPEPTKLWFVHDSWGDEVKDLEIKLRDTRDIYINSEIPYKDKTKVDMPVTLTSSDQSIVTAQLTDENKVTLKAINLGKATVTATTPDGGKASIEVEIIRPDAESIKIDQSGPIKLYPGQKYALTTTITPAEAMPKLTWNSWDTGIATVDQDGMITAVEPGDTRIWVETDNECSDVIDIQVLIPPQKITLSQTKATLAVGDKLTLKATVTPNDAETGITWSSSKPSVATVTQKGKVTALKVGTAKITVKTDNGKKASATITVKPAPTKVKLNKTKATLGVKEKLTLKATVSPSKAYTTLTWKSSKPAVAAVSSQGVVTPKKPGTAVITVRTKNGKTAKATVTVKAAPKKVTLNKSGTVELKKGNKLKLKATLPRNTASALTWTSSKPKVASVDQKGNVRALKKGTAVITVKTFNGRTAKVTIKVQ